MRVLWITTFPPRRCGIGDYSADLAAHLSGAEDLELRIVTYQDGMAKGVVRENGFEVSRRLGGTSPKGVIASEISAFGPDLVHLQSSSFLHPPSVNAEVAETCEVPLVTTVHDTPRSWRAFQVIRGLRKVYAKSSRLLVHSQAVRHVLSSFHGVDGQKIEELPLGVDLEMYSPTVPKGEALKKYALPGRRIVLFFGFVRPGKGLETLLRAWSRIESSYPDTVLVVAGGIPTGARRYSLLLRSEANYPHLLQRLASRLGISRRIIFTGYVPGPLVPSLLATSDVIVLPYVEAVFQSAQLYKSLASGRPVVATEIGGFRELLENGKDGMLVPPGKPEPLADAIKAILDNPVKAHELAIRAREKAERDLSWSAVAARTFDVYESLLSTEGPRTSGASVPA